MTTAPFQLSSRIPLILGVTGHRDLVPADCESLKNRVREIFADLRREYPHTPLVLLTPLVEGADRLVTEVALAAGPEVKIIAVLPWPADACPQGVCRLDNQAEFQQFLNQAEQVIQLPLLEKVTHQELANSDEARKKQFDQVGKFIARHSQILIALWNGKTTSDGGTSKVIAWQREGAPAPMAARGSALDVAEPGPVFHIVTPRSNQDRPKNATSLETIWPTSNEHASTGKTALRGVWRNIDRFNRDALEIEQQRSQSIEKSIGYVVPTHMRHELPGHLRRLLDWYGRADATSLHYQRLTLLSTRMLFAGAFIAITLLEAYAHFILFWPLMVLHLILLMTGFSIYRYVQRQEYQPRYLDYRAFAEALRVQLFWRWAGLTDAVADHYLRHFRGELDWIRTATRTCFLMSGGHDLPIENPQRPEESFLRLSRVRERWIEDQRKYFASNGPKSEHNHLKLEHWAHYAFRAAVLLAIAVIGTEIGLHHPSHFLLLLLFLSLVISALLEDYNNYCGYALHSRKYHWMQQLYTTAAEKLDHAMQVSDAETSRQIIWELGKEALTENADWVVLHRDRLPVWHGG